MGKQTEQRTKLERQKEVFIIIEQLQNLELTPEEPEIAELYKHFKEYIQEGSTIKINIPFKKVNRRIVGILSSSKRQDCWVNLKKEKFD